MKSVIKIFTLFTYNFYIETNFNAYYICIDKKNLKEDIQIFINLKKCKFKLFY